MTSYSGLYDDVHSSPYTVLVDKNPRLRKMSRKFNRPGLIRVGESILTVKTGESLNSAEPISLRRVTEETGTGIAFGNGGLRVMEDVEIVDSTDTTSAADVVLAHRVGRAPALKAKVADESGNNGGNFNPFESAPLLG